MSLALELRGVRAAYGKVEVLHDVSLSVPAGTVVALLGPNGAGKTTTLRVAAGLMSPRAGQVLLGGRDVTRRPAAQRARMGLTLVPEGRGVFPGLTVHHNLALAADRLPAAEREAALAAVLETFPRLAERQHQQAGTMSGGEQQMLALSRGLLARSRVLLLDEISMGLAPRVVEELFEAVAALRESGTTVMLVEQYLTYALRLADICYVLAHGRVAVVAEPAELRRSSAMGGYLTGVLG